MKLSGINVDRSGYAGMRTKVIIHPFLPFRSSFRLTLWHQAKSTLFGLQTWDTAQYSFLRVRLRSPPIGTKASTLRYFVNIQTDGPSRPFSIAHHIGLIRRLCSTNWFIPTSTMAFFTRRMGGRSRLFPLLSSPFAFIWFRSNQIPFTDFTLTNSGELSEKQLPMMREKVRTVGISVMLPFNLPPAAQKLQGNEVEVQTKGLEATDEGHPFDLGLELCVSLFLFMSVCLFL